MEILERMFEISLADPKRVYLKEHRTTTAQLIVHLQSVLPDGGYPEAETLLTACLATAAKEGFANGLRMGLGLSRELKGGTNHGA